MNSVDLICHYIAHMARYREIGVIAIVAIVFSTLKLLLSALINLQPESDALLLSALGLVVHLGSGYFIYCACSVCKNIEKANGTRF